MKKCHVIFTVIILFAIFFGFSPHVSAADDSRQIPFSMEAVLPENQRKEETSAYFDLLVQPNQLQELAVVLTNPSDKELVLKLSANSAVTNNNGIIDYTLDNGRTLVEPKYQLKNLIKLPSKVVLGPGEKKKVSLELRIPQEPFKGVILGGIQAKVDSGSTSEDTGGGLQLENSFATVLGVVLSEDTSPVKPQLKLTNAKAGLSNGYLSVLANIQNTQPTMVGNLTITGLLYKKDEQNVLTQTTKKNQEMAPNSTFDFPIDLTNTPLDAGEYSLKVVAKNKTNKWVLRKTFMITEAQEKGLNKKAVKKNSKTSWWFIVIGLFFVGYLGLVTYRWAKRAWTKK